MPVVGAQRLECCRGRPARDINRDRRAHQGDGPPRRIEVIADHTGVTVRTRVGSGHSGGVLNLIASPWMLLLPLPMRLRARLLFENHATSVQEFLSRVLESAWSSPDAKARVRVTDEQIEVWFGGNDRRDAEVT